MSPLFVTVGLGTSQPVTHPEHDRCILAYTEAGGELSDNYLEKVGSLIRITNIGKFESLIHQLIRGDDIMHRSVGIHDAEARKFLLYLRESEVFEPQ